jgi:hypothetical protein
LFQTYTYDPANPVPTIGGNTLFIACGALDQSPLNNRFVVLLFFVCLFDRSFLDAIEPTFFNLRRQFTINHCHYVVVSTLDWRFLLTVIDDVKLNDFELGFE